MLSVTTGHRLFLFIDKIHILQFLRYNISEEHSMIEGITMAENLTYTRCGDYYIPNTKLSYTEPIAWNRFSQRAHTFVALFLFNLFCKRYAFWNSALYLTIVSLLFTLLSGYVAYLHSKLPKSQREKPNWLSASDFSTHPYFTVALFAVFSVIGLIYLFI